jgi:hypothetical protein
MTTYLTFVQQDVGKGVSTDLSSFLITLHSNYIGKKKAGASYLQRYIKHQTKLHSSLPPRHRCARF